MATIAEQLTSLNNTKTAIRDAISAKGVSVSDTDTFASYADKIAEIPSGTEVNKTKFGCTIDNFLGDVDSEGNYVKPTEKIVLDLTGVKSVKYWAFANKFYINGASVEVKAPDLTSVSEEAFSYAFYGAKEIVAHFDSLEEITGAQAFYATFGGGGYASPTRDVSFPKLKRIAADNAFNACFDRNAPVMDEVFPVLEEVSGWQLFNLLPNGDYTFSALKKITGGSDKYQAPFYIGISGTFNFYFPRVTEITNYAFRPYSSYPVILHFAVANQAAIEACEGYDYMFGATAIYFDLITTITIDGVAYSRGLTIDGYTAWEDTSGNTVYTDATAEPAVDTVVYSDAGTTQVGTVSAVE